MCAGLPSALWPHLWALTLVLGLVIPSAPAQAQGSQLADLELALLVDVSASVSDEEFRLQAVGLAVAFRSPAVLEAIRATVNSGIAVGVLQWANRENQRMSVEWTLLRGDADALALAARIAAMPRLISGGHTALGSALAYALRELESNRFAGLRRVIDVSGDGRANDGLPLRAVREEVLEHRVTINGLAILNELPLLDRYFRDRLIGGEGAFVMVAQDYPDFAEAMAVKLEREIRAVPLAQKRRPGYRPWRARDRRAFVRHVENRERPRIRDLTGWSAGSQLRWPEPSLQDSAVSRSMRSRRKGGSQLSRGASSSRA